MGNSGLDVQKVAGGVLAHFPLAGFLVENGSSHSPEPTNA
jgi:hypothetical protein